MIRLTKQTDYALVLLSTLAAGGGQLARSAPELAKEAGLPLPMVSKILKLLAREGILESERGAHGGYRFARAPRETSVADVIVIIEGPIAITECSHPATSQCDLEGSCQLSANWRRINDAVVGALTGINLDDLARPMHCSAHAAMESAAAT